MCKVQRDCWLFAGSKHQRLKITFISGTIEGRPPIANLQAAALVMSFCKTFNIHFSEKVSKNRMTNLFLTLNHLLVLQRHVYPLYFCLLFSHDVRNWACPFRASKYGNSATILLRTVFTMAFAWKASHGHVATLLEEGGYHLTEQTRTDMSEKPATGVE